MSRIIKSSRVVEEKGDSLIKKIGNREEEILLENAKEKYDEIVSIAGKEAESMIEKGKQEKKVILNEAYEKAEKKLNEWKEEGHEEGLKTGYEKGYAKGYEDGEKDSSVLIDEALEIKEKYIEQKESIYRETEKDMINLVVKVCEKVIYDKVDEDEKYIVSLVLKGIDSLNTTENLIIRVSKEDYGVVEKSKNKILAKASLVSELEIKIDSNLKKGDCIIETSKGNVDVSIDYQVRELKELLNNILNSE